MYSKVVGTTLVVDLSKLPYEFASPEFLNLHLKDLAVLNKKITKIRYEEEIVVELDPKKTFILLEYANVIKQVEKIMLQEKIYGSPYDENYNNRKVVLRRFYEDMFVNPVIAAKDLEEYHEPPVERKLFLKSQQTFRAWINGILNRFKKTKLYALVKKTGDLRTAFLSLTGLKSLYFVDSLILNLPPEAKPVKGAKYNLDYGIYVQIYEIPKSDTYLYVLENPIIKKLPEKLKKMLKNHILSQVKEDFSGIDQKIVFELKTKEYRQYFLDQAVLNGITITPDQALAMGRECAAWVVGLGAYIENMALDENVTDIYIDGENVPIYIEHAEYGICHTLFRYNRDLLERVFRNIVLSEKGKKFDENVPVVDVVITRLNMRCHLQRPPATFGELQGALRIMKSEPFTYPMYLYYESMTPFFAGYDDVLVTLGTSEGVLGLKGSGKTSFTAAKIVSIGTKKRIIPIEDIQEIPINAFRKRGFHIGATKVQSTQIEAYKTKTLDLVSMANALLRMGDAAIIINEIRSKSAVQGLLNLLNTQPGTFLLYNLHAESLRDVQDRLELVFGIPSVAMLATDRFSFIDKIHFGRKGRLYRMIGAEYESDQIKKEFVQTYELKKGNSSKSSILVNKFLKNKEASAWSYQNYPKTEKELNINFIPPALKRRASNTGVKPEQYLLQAFFKGKVFQDIYQRAIKTNNLQYLHIDFVLKANETANRILYKLENENGEVDFKEAAKIWQNTFKNLTL